MAIKDDLLKLLEDNKGKYISGEEIASSLNVSRAGVWKAIKKLQNEGFSIEGVNNKGYMLSVDTDVLSASGVNKFLNENVKINLEVVDSIDSTNLEIKRRFNEPEWLVVAANEQTAGMGRLGRSFSSPSETGIYFSILLKPSFSGEEVTLLTSIAAVAVCEAIEKYTDKKPQIKWVNDIFIDDKKVCGILTQGSYNLENMSTEYVVVGIGINLYQPNGGFEKDIKKIAGNVISEKTGDFKNKILSEVLNRYYHYYKNFSNKEFIKPYVERSLVIGRDVYIVNGEDKRKVKAIDIDDMCHLIVETQEGNKEVISTGEISVRLS